MSNTNIEPLTITQLTNNMSKFESLYLEITIAIGVVSFIALIISIFTYFATSKANKAALLHQVKISIDDAKTQLENMTLKLAELQSKKSLTADEKRKLTIQESVYDSALEKLLNAYENGCQKYKSNLILKDEFKRSYHSDIRKYIEAFEDKFSGPLTEYSHMLYLYNEWHKIKMA